MFAKLLGGECSDVISAVGFWSEESRCKRAFKALALPQRAATRLPVAIDHKIRY
jgi:hypothetical protein